LASPPLLTKNTLDNPAPANSASIAAARSRTGSFTALLWKIMLAAWSAIALTSRGWP
jgi:hypothetical protein